MGLEEFVEGWSESEEAFRFLGSFNYFHGIRILGKLKQDNSELNLCGRATVRLLLL